ncbi:MULTISPECIES: hypothetical protein [unclassified Okeania]|uniref:hypothetical protein n=1 Tax=unclassified Okeania TaxID=2634635 RepID=UPI0013B9E6A2|nr:MULTISPECIES: hypothetical protein [unclassified Okeania]NET11986.1 hypothetical protein [Okeania sp. SIO1H6]NES76942.1 hypothetical protein [Okeania sp. SIO1H4]NES92309.1 hypothetical protein [Okeania sp. SIO2B9]NET20633.1 hypothetical protein [Okeania sp. SIO1H5]NET92490.1 hypothetical protein [Okeania sp. SIO1H2]
MQDFSNIDSTRLTLEPGFLKPTVSDTDQIADIENSELRKIANDVLDAAKYSFTTAAANVEQQARPETLEATFQEAIKGMNEEKRASVRSKATELTMAPQAIREIQFGRYGKLSSQEYLSMGIDRVEEANVLPKLEIDQKLLGLKTPVLTLPQSVAQMTDAGLLIPKDQLPARISNQTDFEGAAQEVVKTSVDSEVYDAEKLQQVWGPVYSEDPFGVSDSDDFEEQAVTDKLGFYITRVKCLDETNPEFWGSDEIALAGVSVDETGDTKKVPEKFIGGGFDDGDQKTYSPHWKYHWFNMREGQYWPKAYKVSLILAEKDNGGLSSVLNTIYVKIRDYVKKAIAKAVAGALSSLVGPAIAKAIGQITAWLVDKLIGWIINLFKDDIFPVKVLSCTVPSFGARWYYPNGKWGSPTSGIRTAHFYGHGGHYIINYYWKLYA